MSRLFWWFRGDLQNIRQVVSMLLGEQCTLYEESGSAQESVIYETTNNFAICSFHSSQFNFEKAHGNLSFLFLFSTILVLQSLVCSLLTFSLKPRGLVFFTRAHNLSDTVNSAFSCGYHSFIWRTRHPMWVKQPRINWSIKASCYDDGKTMTKRFSFF